MCFFDSFCDQMHQLAVRASIQIAQSQRRPRNMESKNGCSARSERLLKPMLSYIGALFRAQREGLW